MANDAGYRLYAMLKSTPELELIYKAKDFAKLTDYTARILKSSPYSAEGLISRFKAVGAPSWDWKAAFVGSDIDDAPPFDELSIVYRFDDANSQEQFLDISQKVRMAEPTADIRGAGAEISVGSTDGHWCPGQGRSATFGNRSDARRTVNANSLVQGGLDGENVNVVIIDQGLCKAAIDVKNWGGGLNWSGGVGSSITVGSAARTSHGMMIARSVLDLAPAAKLYDVPLIPDRIGSIDEFLRISSASSAQAVFKTILAHIDTLRTTPPWTGPWLLVNAWAIYDRATESPLGNYTENSALAHGFDHPLIQEVKTAVTDKNIDVIFAAGNCGEFCASRRCGGQDRGPKHSIWGANGIGEVITTGAVRADTTWVGYSSQGPGVGVHTLAQQKPDLSAPSDFCETTDAAVRNSGTSTSCAVVAGVVAALRSKPAWYQMHVTPEMMRQALIASARKTIGQGWNGRTGYGVVDASAAMAELP